MKTASLLCLVSVLIMPALCLADSLKVGDQAPDFSVAASDGTTVHLKDYLGKGNIVLYFYPKDDTPGCTKEACGIRDTIGELKGLNATVFGVSFDSIESHKKFIEKYKLPFLLLADTQKEVAKAYKIADDSSRIAPRSTFIIDKSGKIVYANLKVDPTTNSADVRTALAGLDK
jgi:peroxiredoxin Q/BCP